MACVGIDELEAFLSGTCDESSRTWIARHVEDCSACQSRLRELEQDIPLEHTVRACFARMTVADRVAEPGAQLGPYRVVREIGRGGTGVVYEAQQAEPQRRVALKLLNAACAVDARYERLLIREARALARLRHPCIAAIHDAGRAPDGRPFFVMDLIEGETLVAFARRRELPVEARIRLFCQVCDAVAHAHQRAVVHRDLKPSNILVDADGRPTVLDFGLARILEPALEEPQAAARSLVSEIGRVAGTVPYMSPEHVLGRPSEIDVRSDVYCLGVVLYELLTGQLPYPVDGGNLSHAAHVICNQPATPPGRLDPRVRGDLETIVLKALQKEPERRYQSVSELAVDLRRYLACEPIVARPPSAWYQLTRFAQRNRVLVGSAAVALLAVLTGAAAAVVQAQVATAQRDAAQRRMEYAQTTANYVFAGVGSQIGGVPGTAGIQRHLAEEAYVFYRRLAEESPDDLSAQVWLWMSLRRLAWISLHTGQIERAELLAALLEQRIAAFAGEHPPDARIPREQMFTQLLLGTLAAGRGDAQSVSAHARRAVELRDLATTWLESQGSAIDSPLTVPQHGNETGRRPPLIQVSGGWAHELAGEFGEALAAADPTLAEEQFREALAILEANEAVDPTLQDIYREDTSEYAPLAGPIRLRDGSRPLYDQARSALLKGLGKLALARGEAPIALHHLQTALELAQRPHPRWPQHPQRTGLRAAIHAAIAAALQESGDPAAAEHHAQAVAAFESLVASDPEDVRWQRALAALR